MGKWGAIIALGLAQFVMVLDTTVMNVSITAVSEDLDATVPQIQIAITLYTLVMAAFMLAGAKLGDIHGRRRALSVGLAVYAVGSLTTALSVDVWMLYVGWSLIEGLGAVLVIPAIAALIAANYEGKDRALAYGIIGGIAGAGAALGPLIGGWVTTEWTWRVVFAAEVVVVIGVLAVRKVIRDAPPPERRPGLDVVGTILSAFGLGLVVFAILRASEWGWLFPKAPPEIGGRELTPLGFSPVPFIVLAGLGILALLLAWEERVERKGGEPLVHRALLRVDQLRAGLQTLASYQLVLMGFFFVIPVYLQVVLGKDALETGVHILPMSITLMIASLGGSRLASRVSPRRLSAIGFLLLAIGAVLVLDTISPELDSGAFAAGMAVFGLGVGLIASQTGNVIMSSVGEAETSEAGGLQGTAQNLGASLGTALIGAVLLTGLTTGFQERVLASEEIPPQVQEQIVEQTEAGVEIVSEEQARAAAEDAGLPPDQVDAVVDAYGDAQIDALKTALLIAAALAVLAGFGARRLPRKPLAAPDDGS